MSIEVAVHGRGLLIRRALLVLFALLLAVQVVKLHMADYFTAVGIQGDDAALDSALWWDDAQPRALELQARALLRQIDEELDAADLDNARDLLRRAVQAEPARGNNLALLALAQQRAGEDGSAAADIADRLAPVHPRVQRNLASFYLIEENLAQAVSHIARAMVGAPRTARDYYPLLMQVAADPAAREVLLAIAADPQPFPWWNGFFAHVAANAENLDALRGLVKLRESSTALPLQEYERNAYINRLRREGLVSEAYLYWVNGLSQEQLGSLGYLYDGSFEQDFANDAGFGWVARPPHTSGIRISRGDTYGASNDSALRLSFRGKRQRFSHVYQYIFLGAGDYTVSGRVRPDQLQTRRGLQWRLYCSAGSSGVLGESELFSGTGDWRRFEFSVTVPAECRGEVLRLYSAGQRDVDHELQGTIWFDDMQIELVR
jgi:hypothetical protein